VTKRILSAGHGARRNLVSRTLKFLTFGAVEHSLTFKRRARSLSTGGVCVGSPGRDSCMIAPHVLVEGDSPIQNNTNQLPADMG